MQYSPESDSEDELPPGWEERATLSGEVYYVNHVQTSTQWTHPRTGRSKVVSDKLPFGWERQILEDQKVVYIDHQNKRTTYTDPRLAFAEEKITSADSDQKLEFRQKHDASTTALQVLHGLDLTGRTAVVTGGSQGIGFHTARALALHGATVVIANRSQDKGEKACKDITKERASARVSYLHLDLASLDSVHQFVKKLAVLHPKIHYLVLNAGVYGLPYKLTDDGMEYMMQVNYVANFYMVKLLFKGSILSSDSSITFVGSESHRFAPVDSPEAMDSLTHFSPLPSQFCAVDQYNISKLYCLLFAECVHNEYSKYGIRCTAVHPGNLVSTNLASSWWLYRLIYLFARPFTKSADQAAGSVVFALCSQDVADIEGFVYINNCFPTRPSHQLEDHRFAAKLWDMTSKFLQSKNRL
eukprot:TRINITY_DN28239_c0_g1_i14.p1 TRINITY_DN28239_c0_g1~~TRINITY_DN28239_c0_g1_i14.p1  ORF type:complete len:413 (-),score=74.31 TRINITY_DN28239_c0_g1_i14:150-1388(-)